MPWVEVGSTDLHYTERGTGEPLVLIHGALSSAETWYRHVDAFSARYRVLAYDSVNHGLSSNSPRDEPEPDRADELEHFLAATRAERPAAASAGVHCRSLRFDEWPGPDPGCLQFWRANRWAA